MIQPSQYIQQASFLRDQALAITASSLDEAEEAISACKEKKRELQTVKSAVEGSKKAAKLNHKMKASGLLALSGALLPTVVKSTTASQIKSSGKSLAKAKLDETVHAYEATKLQIDEYIRDVARHISKLTKVRDKEKNKRSRAIRKEEEKRRGLTKRKCSACKKQIDARDAFCRFCGEELR